ncbi:MAG: hypothetical protein ACYSUC_01020, partial [Planctomycetota bacterium]
MAAKTETIAEQQPLEGDKKHLKTVALRAYSSHKGQPVDDERIAELLPMVRKIVQRVATYLKPP